MYWDSISWMCQGQEIAYMKATRSNNKTANNIKNLVNNGYHYPLISEYWNFWDEGFLLWYESCRSVYSLEERRRVYGKGCGTLRFVIMDMDLNGTYGIDIYMKPHRAASTYLPNGHISNDHLQISFFCGVSNSHVPRITVIIQFKGIRELDLSSRLLAVFHVLSHRSKSRWLSGALLKLWW